MAKRSSDFEANSKSLWIEVLKETVPYLPKPQLSRFGGWLASQNLPSWVRKKSISWFVKQYKLNMDEAEKPLEAYPTLAELFTRNLKPGARPIGEGVVHPADSFLTDGGTITSEQLIQSKGRTYSVHELLGEHADSEAMIGGHLLTYYLCPADYHHVHSPVDGHIESAHLIQGNLWPVNPWSLSKFDSVFTENERIVIKIKLQNGVCYLIMVGATVVGKMTLDFEPNLTGNSRKGSQHIDYSDKPILVKRGDRIGSFHLGSTVIMIYGPGVLPNGLTFSNGPVQFGQALIKSESTLSTQSL